MELVRRLEWCTGQSDLACGSLIKLASALAENRNGSLFAHRRWCPECYRQDTFGYEPLSWSLIIVSKCFIHGTNLESACHLCGAHQNTITSYSTRRICRNCKKPLGHAANPAMNDEWSNWCDIQGEDLLAQVIALEPNPPIPIDPLSIFAKVARQSVFSRAARRWLEDIFGPACSKANKTHRRPQLITIFKVAAFFHVRPTDILLRPAECAGSPLFELAAPIPKPLRHKQFCESNVRKCKAFIESALNANDQSTALPSLADLLKRFSVSRSRFFYRNNDLWLAYTKKRRAQRNHVSNNRKDCALKAARVLLCQFDNPYAASRVDIIAQIRKLACVSKADARSALQYVLQELKADSESSEHVNLPSTAVKCAGSDATIKSDRL
jgi:hypothetical protein